MDHRDRTRLRELRDRRWSARDALAAVGGPRGPPARPARLRARLSPATALLVALSRASGGRGQRAGRPGERRPALRPGSGRRSRAAGRHQRRPVRNRHRSGAERRRAREEHGCPITAGARAQTVRALTRRGTVRGGSLLQMGGRRPIHQPSNAPSSPHSLIPVRTSSQSGEHRGCAQVARRLPAVASAPSRRKSVVALVLQLANNYCYNLPWHAQENTGAAGQRAQTSLSCCHSFNEQVQPETYLI